MPSIDEPQIGLWSKDSSSGLREVNYGFIGLGVMGFGMAKNLHRHLPPSSTLIVSEINKPQLDKFLSETSANVKVANSPKEVAEQADIIITMLPKGPHVWGVFTNPTNGLLAIEGEQSEKLFIDCSTIDTATSLRVFDAVTASNLGRFVDAPVSGGPNGAHKGTLTFMLGGSDAAIADVLPVVKTMGKESSIFYCGGPGAGLATKQVNNYLSGVCIIGVSEAMNMGIRYGLDPKTLANVINVSSGKCYNSLDQNPVKGVTATAAAAKDFEGGFSMELCMGVLEMAVELGEQVGAKSVLSQVVMETFREAAKDERCRGKDCRSLYRWLADV